MLGGLIVWENIVVSIIAFAILYFFLNKYAFGPLFGIMEKRRQMIQDQIDNAAKDKTESSALLAEQRKALEEARKDAFDIIEQAKKTSSGQADEIINQAKAEAVRLKEEAVRDIETEKNKALAALRGEVGEMSVRIASKIIEKQIDEKSQSELVDQYLKEVGG